MNVGFRFEEVWPAAEEAYTGLGGGGGGAPGIYPTSHLYFESRLASTVAKKQWRTLNSTHFSSFVAKDFETTTCDFSPTDNTDNS